MKKQQQLEIAQEISNCFHDDFTAAISKCPEEWDGFEIRQFAVDWFNYHYTSHNKPGVHSFGNKRKKRRKDYEQDKYKLL